MRLFRLSRPDRTPRSSRQRDHEPRREDYLRFGAIWHELHSGQVGADAIDEQLHAERLAPGTRDKLRHRTPVGELPDGAFVLEEGAPWVVVGLELLRWTPAGYAERRRRRAGAEALVITPPSLVAVLRTGWEPVVPLLHPSALAGAT